VGGGVPELGSISFQDLINRTSRGDGGRERFVLSHSLEIKGLHPFELVVRIAGKCVGGALRREQRTVLPEHAEQWMPVHILVISKPQQTDDVGIALEKKPERPPCRDLTSGLRQLLGRCPFSIDAKRRGIGYSLVRPTFSASSARADEALQLEDSAGGAEYA
jgi:hypothetical protein